YKGIEASKLIFDQTTNDRFLNVFVTADRIDLSDSLYINNINLASILRNDSLNFNIKLSDLNAYNQLDLNGLEEFNTEAAVRLSLLPSDILINSEEWKIQEEARFDFEDGKTLISGLDLTQGSQVVSINGAVSNLEEDILTVDFDSFSLRTLNPIARSAG